jgi:hypothetical protein
MLLFYIFLYFDLIYPIVPYNHSIITHTHSMLKIIFFQFPLIYALKNLLNLHFIYYHLVLAFFMVMISHPFIIVSLYFILLVYSFTIPIFRFLNLLSNFLAFLWLFNKNVTSLPILFLLPYVFQYLFLESQFIFSFCCFYKEAVLFIWINILILLLIDDFIKLLILL